MKILITGAAGFIGRSLAKWLLENTTHKVIGMDDFSGGFLHNIPPGCVFYKANVCDSSYFNKLFKLIKPDIVYHLAAYASEGRSNSIRSFIHKNNTVGTANVINACINHNCKLIFMSSVAVYSGTPPFAEETKPQPIDEYGLSKYMSELSIKIAGEQQGLDWCIVRPRNVYGPFQNLFDPSRNLFGIMCYNALNNLPIKIFGTGMNIRNFTYIDDILPCLYRVNEYSKEVFNLGSETEFTINEAVKMFSFVTGYANTVHVEARHEVPLAFCKTRKSREMLGHKEVTKLEDGIKKMWDWAKTREMLRLMTPPVLEVTKNVHSSSL